MDLKYAGSFETPAICPNDAAVKTSPKNTLVPELEQNT